MYVLCACVCVHLNWSYYTSGTYTDNCNVMVYIFCSKIISTCCWWICVWTPPASRRAWTLSGFQKLELLKTWQRSSRTSKKREDCWSVCAVVIVVSCSLVLVFLYSCPRICQQIDCRQFSAFRWNLQTLSCLNWVGTAFISYTQTCYQNFFEYVPHGLKVFLH